MERDFLIIEGIKDGDLNLKEELFLRSKNTIQSTIKRFLNIGFSEKEIDIIINESFEHAIAIYKKTTSSTFNIFYKFVFTRTMNTLMMNEISNKNYDKLIKLVDIKTNEVNTKQDAVKQLSQVFTVLKQMELDVNEEMYTVLSNHKKIANCIKLLSEPKSTIEENLLKSKIKNIVVLNNILEFLAFNGFEIIEDEIILNDDEDISLDGSVFSIPNHPLLTPEEEIEAFKRIEENPSRENIEYIVEHNQRLVMDIIKRYFGNGLDIEDLFQEGNLGLLKAIEKYDYKKGNKFSTYATWWIRQATKRALQDKSRTVRFPVHASEALEKINKYEKKIFALEGRIPDEYEIAEILDMPASKVKKIRELENLVPQSLDQPVKNDEPDSTLLEFIIDDSDSADTELVVSESQLRETILEVLDELNPREKEVIIRRFGLNNCSPETLSQVGEAFGITRERIRQIEAKALRKLRHPIRANKLRDFLIK